MISLREMELTAGQQVVENLDGATLTFPAASAALPQLKVPCTITKILTDFVLVFEGKSSKTFVQICLFRAALVGNRVLTKGDLCSLSPYPGATPYAMRLWHGGLMPGGAVYQFMLVDENYSAS